MSRPDLFGPDFDEYPATGVRRDAEGGAARGVPPESGVGAGRGVPPESGIGAGRGVGSHMSRTSSGSIRRVNNGC